MCSPLKKGSAKVRKNSLLLLRLEQELAHTVNGEGCRKSSHKRGQFRV